MPLLTFDQFEAAVLPLLDEAAGAHDDLPVSWRLGDQGGWGDNPLSPLGHAVVALARIAPWVDRPLEPGPHYITAGDEPPRRGDVRAEALTAVAQLLEVLAGVRSTMPAELAAARAAGERDGVARCAFEAFAAPGDLPVEGLEWMHAIEQAGTAATGLGNPRLGAEIGPSLAHDALERSTGSAVCVLALIDARRAIASP